MLLISPMTLPPRRPRTHGSAVERNEQRLKEHSLRPSLISCSIIHSSLSKGARRPLLAPIVDQECF